MSLPPQVPGGLQYRGDYLVPVGEALAASHGAALAGPDATIADRRTVARSRPRLHDCENAGRHPSRIWPPSAWCRTYFPASTRLLAGGAVERAIATLQERGLIYEGVLEPPQAAKPRTTGSPAPKPCSAPPNSATTSIARCAKATAATPISPTTSPTTRTRWRAARNS